MNRLIDWLGERKNGRGALHFHFDIQTLARKTRLTNKSFKKR